MTDPELNPPRSEAGQIVRYETTRGLSRDEFGPVELCAVYEDGSVRFVSAVSYHSPTGLEYGYGGSGPADMALTILADFHGLDVGELGRKMSSGDGHDWSQAELRSINWHQALKFELIAKADRSVPLIVYVGDIVQFIASQIAKEQV